MLIVVNKTYRGKHGLYLQGHPYNLPKYLIGQIDAEMMMRNPPEKFDFREVDDPKQINKPAKDASAIVDPTAVKIRIKKPYDGKLGKLNGGQIIEVLPDKLAQFDAEKVDYEKVKAKNPKK